MRDRENPMKAMKRQWKPHEKSVKNPKNQVCAKKYKKDGFAICDHFFPRMLPFFVTAADLAVRNYLLCSMYEFFEAFSHSGPLLKRPR